MKLNLDDDFKMNIMFDDDSGPAGNLEIDSDDGLRFNSKYPISFKDMVDVVGIMEKLKKAYPKELKK